MPPKKKATASVGVKRARSPSPRPAEKTSDSDSTATPSSPPASPVVVRATIGNRTTGPLVRSPETLAALAIKRSKEDIWNAVVPFQRLTTDSDYDSKTMMKLITWNVAGLRGLLKKDEHAISTLLRAEGADVLCLQETKLNVGDAANETLGVVPGYTFVDHPCAAKRGYSGTRTYLRTASMVETLGARSEAGFMSTPQAASAASDATLMPEGDIEGRVLTTVFQLPRSKAGQKTDAAAAAVPSHIALVNTYVANSGMTLDRLPYRTKVFDRRLQAYLQDLEAEYGAFIWAGDLNVAERDFDRYYTGTFKTMQALSGFTPEERHSFRQTLRETKSVDAFRALYPQSGPSYTYWSARINGREKGMGWRLDYFVLSSALAHRAVDCFPMEHVMGSDHCPVQLWLRKP